MDTKQFDKLWQRTETLIATINVLIDLERDHGDCLLEVRALAGGIDAMMRAPASSVVADVLGELVKSHRRLEAKIEALTAEVAATRAHG